MKSKALLILHQKKIFKGGGLLEMKMWKVERGRHYPEGIKCGLIFLNLKTGKRVLMDNHSPKGHHYHLDFDEFPYLYQDMDQLVQDFRSLVHEHLGVKL